jgi:hypothetical protein
LEVSLVALVDGDDEGHVPPVGSQAEEAQSVVGLVQGGGLDGQAEGFAGVIESGEALDTVVAVAVGDRDEQGQLASVLEAVES